MEGYNSLVTGSEGFCGHHLTAYLLDHGHAVAGFDRQNEASAATYTGNINDVSTLQAALHATQPTHIFHLAALTNPRMDYEELHRVNALGTLSLLTAAREICPHATILVTSSSAVYGRVPSGALPITEDQPFGPMTSYATSKIAQEMVSYQQFAQHGMRVIRTRAFNLTGPGESPNFVTSAFAHQIAQIEAGLREPTLHVGNLDTVRDFTDVRDAVRAYTLLAEQDEPGEVYNVCSGQGTSIRDLLDVLLDLSTRRGIAVQVDPARLQPSDVPTQVGDAGRLHALTGWTPLIPFRQTLEDVLNYWRTKVNEELA